MKKTSLSKTNNTIYDKPMSKEKLVNMIKAAENVKFHSMEDLNKKITE